MRRLVPALAAAVLIALAAPAGATALPNIDVECNRSSTCEGVWFATPVFVDWTVAGATSTDGCQDVTIDYDVRESPQGCIAKGTGTTSATVLVSVDLSPPLVTGAVPQRPPDHAGWYTQPVTFSVTGSDSMSGLEACDPVTYAGPDSAAATVTATCRDAVGHVGSRAFPLRYDATAPDVSGVAAETGDRRVRLHWPAAASATVVRTPGVGGEPASALTAATDGMTDLRVRNGASYRYVVTLADEAGNSASRELVAVPGPRLLTPAKRAQVTAPPHLRWTPVRGARYYNVQLLRGDRKVLSAWPRRPELKLQRAWRFRGERRRLKPGRYRWYVWPAKGPRASNEYGPRLGARSFVVARP